MIIIIKNISAGQKEIGINFPVNVYKILRHFPKLLTENSHKTTFSLIFIWKSVLLK